MTAAWKGWFLAGWGPADPRSGIPTPASAPIPALGTFYVQPPDFRPEVIRARRCRCHDGHASIDCSMHCHLVITRQHVEDELLVLALV